MDGLTLCAACVVLYLLYIVQRRSRNPIRRIPGPPSSSWVYGNLRELLLASEYGEHEFKWQSQYGPLYRIKGCFGEDRLMVSDAAALKHILSDTSTFVRSPQQQQIVRMLLGEGSLFYVHGSDHQRVRSVMNPAFSHTNVRALPSVFQKIAEKIAETWETSCTSDPKGIMNVAPALHNGTLDAIGEAAMGYSFNTVEQGLEGSEIARSFHNLVPMSSSRTKASILGDSILPYLPSTVLRLALLLPTTTLRLIRHSRVLTGKIAVDLIEAKSEAFKLGLEPERDLLSVIVSANTSTKASNKMSDMEMQDQISTVMLAGQETAANTIAWILYELAKSPACQDKIRAEIREAYSTNRELGYAHYETMTYMNAFIKEGLRLYAPLPLSERVAEKDTVVPLSQPIITTDGERITELPIKKGQFIIMAIASYHKLPAVWGSDADEFKPSRWLTGEHVGGKALGPYGTLLSFLGGPRACIGWRFALTEIQVIVAELVRKFTFALPEDVITRQSLAVTVIPVSNGIQRLPLRVEIAE